MRNRKLVVSKMKVLCRALQLERPFLFKIPKHTVYYTPIYDWPLGINPGDFLLFCAENLSLKEVFLAEVKVVSKVGGEHGLTYLDVECVKRPQNRGKHGMVNQLSKVKIFEKSIVCLLQASRSINGH